MSGVPLGVIQSEDATPPVNETIFIMADGNNLNFLDLWLASFPAAGAGDTANFIINGSPVIGSADSNDPAIRTGVWPAGVNLNFTNNSSNVRGRGGDGNGPNPGKDGGDAFLAEAPITINNSGTLGGGGGGGAGTDQLTGTSAGGFQTYAAGGAGGAGNPGGSGFTPAGSTNLASGTSGSATTGGIGGGFGQDPNQPQNPNCKGGNGGSLGAPGFDASDVANPGSEDNVGGAAGYGVRNGNLVTWLNQGNLPGGILP